MDLKVAQSCCPQIMFLSTDNWMGRGTLQSDTTSGSFKIYHTSTFSPNGEANGKFELETLNLLSCHGPVNYSYVVLLRDGLCEPHFVQVTLIKTRVWIALTSLTLILGLLHRPRWNMQLLSDVIFPHVNLSEEAHEEIRKNAELWSSKLQWYSFTLSSSSEFFLPLTSASRNWMVATTHPQPACKIDRLARVNLDKTVRVVTCICERMFGRHRSCRTPVFCVQCFGWA